MNFERKKILFSIIFLVAFFVFLGILLIFQNIDVKVEISKKTPEETKLSETSNENSIIFNFDGRIKNLGSNYLIASPLSLENESQEQLFPEEVKIIVTDETIIRVFEAKTQEEIEQERAEIEKQRAEMEQERAEVSEKEKVSQIEQTPEKQTEEIVPEEITINEWRIRRGSSTDFAIGQEIYCRSPKNISGSSEFEAEIIDVKLNSI